MSQNWYMHAVLKSRHITQETCSPIELPTGLRQTSPSSQRTDSLETGVQLASCTSAVLSPVLPEALKAWLALLEALPDPQASNQL